MKKNTPLSAACIIGLFVLCAAILLGNVLMPPLMNTLYRSGVNITITLSRIIQVIKNALGMFLALFLYCLLISKKKLHPGFSILASVLFGITSLVTHFIQGAIVFYIICFVFGGLYGLVYLKLTTQGQSDHMAFTNTNASGIPAQPVTPNQTPFTQTPPPDMSGLLVAVLNAIRPQLKAPLTATLCEQEHMMITNNNGEYEIQGFVNSQNSYGAMIATDFAVTARFSNGTWTILKTSIGVKAAKNFAKSFASNYIAISVFSIVMGLLLYFLITLAIG